MSGNIPEPVRRLVALPEKERKIGAFHLKQQLGQGGFAPVWLADEVAGSTTLRQAAVKLFQLASGEEARQAIIDEAERLCRLTHPNVVRFYALPVDEARGVVGLAMEYVAGKSLAQVLVERGRLPLNEAIDVGIALASALLAVHGAGLVHRDVQPANVMVDEARRGSSEAYKLIDFGIAGGRPPRSSRKTNPDHTPLPGLAAFNLGKRGYVDPAIVRMGAVATSASDLYGLGAVLYVCLSGRLPARGEEGLDEDVLSGVKSAPSLGEALPSAPAPLVELVDALLSPDPEGRPRSAELVAVELERLRGALAGRGRSLPPEEEGPFRGLSRFESEHRDVFFGRRVEVAAALEVLRTRGLLALVGPSGSGKSSLARAGILPALEEGALGGARVWERVVVSPGQDPRQVLTTALFHVQIDPGWSPERAAARLEAWVGEERRGLVILVDQLEELATLQEKNDGLVESREWTKSLLARLGNKPWPGLRVIVTARRDLLDGILAHPAMGRVLGRGMVLVSPLKDAAWGEVIDAALTSYGYTFEDADLRKDVLDSLSATVEAMPLVEFALTKLWSRRDRENRRITRAAWREVGGIAGALDEYATEVLRRAEREAGVSEAGVKRALLSMTTPSGARVARDIASLTDEGRDAAVAAVIRLFEEARLLVREGEKLTLAHEALLVHWGKLSTWLAEEREARLLLADLDEAATQWLKHGDDELLWRQRRLLLVQEILRDRGVVLEGSAKRFYEASLWAFRRGRILFWTLGTLAVLVAAFGYGYVIEQRARRVAAEALAKQETAAREQAQAAQLKAEAAQVKAEAERAKAEALAQSLRVALASAQERPTTVLLPAESPSTVPSTTPASVVLAQGTVDKIEEFLLQQQRENEPVPPSLQDFIPEAVAPQEPVAVASLGSSAPAVPTAPVPTATAVAQLPALQSLPSGVAFSALRDAQGRVASCARMDGPHGMGKLAVVIGTDGRVASVALERPFAGTAVGDCVDAIFRNIKVPPSGSKPVTVLWSFTVPGGG
jgi:serine/threonine protein kinase/type II secretory pathway predicted ATPase ExeA